MAIIASMLTLYALSDIGIPYIFGGNDMDGIDCSGFVLRPLKKVDIIHKDRDYTAQAIYDKLVKMGFSESEPGQDCILFFGQSTSKITHVSIAINKKAMIEASGGDSRCLLLEQAIKRDARVQINPIDRRSDLVASIKVKY